MNRVFKQSLLSMMIATIISPVAVANGNADDSSVTEQLTIFGSDQSVNDVPGSAHLLSQKDLEKFDYSDIMRTLT
ncbi:MAG: hypothetical protein OQK09_16285, partial [Colwellia sp.]|nr:hypothetical protein [Colwellia sp.]